MSNQLSLVLRSPRVLIAAGVGVAAAAGIANYMMRRPKPSEEELERARREALALTGRITDGTILDTILNTMEETMQVPSAETASRTLTAVTDSPEHSEAGETAGVAVSGPGSADAGAVPPHIIVYKYRIAGVSYECAQDVSMLAEHVHGIRSDLPIQVRYELHNPGNSIVVAESWNGLRLISSDPRRPGSNSAA